MTDEQQTEPMGAPAEPAPEAAAAEPAVAEPTAEISAEPTADAPAKHVAEAPEVEQPAAETSAAPARHLADDPTEERVTTAERAPRGPGDTAERQPVNAQPPAYVKLHLQGNMLLSMITPKVQIDGYPAPAKYGENLFPVAPGQHVVAAHAQWMWQYGKAQQPVALAPGETAELWYATPVLTFLPGAMGASKQRHPGMMILLLLCGVALAFVVALVIFALGT